LVKLTTADLPDFPANAFTRYDDADDAEFYVPTRLVTHIDATAIAALTGFYGQHLPKDGVLLDLMSSWVSHLPDELAVSEMIGLGMNEAELAANPRLTRRIVQNLNRDTTLPLGDASCDGAMCCVSVQYLQKPVEVFAEVRRVLRSGAPFIVSFSNRCFPTKAVAIWRSLDTFSHAELIQLYFGHAGFSAIRAFVLVNGRDSDPMIALMGLA
jgi:SAM-dependent methyltransferase